MASTTSAAREAARDEASGARGTTRTRADVARELLAQCDPADPIDAPAIAHYEAVIAEAEG